MSKVSPTKAFVSVTISDSYSAGPQGETTTVSKTYTYSRTIDARTLAYGENFVDNTATPVSDDGANETDDHK